MGDTTSMTTGPIYGQRIDLGWAKSRFPADESPRGMTKNNLLPNELVKLER